MPCGFPKNVADLAEGHLFMYIELLFLLDEKITLFPLYC